MEILRDCPFCESKDIKLVYQESSLVWKLYCVLCGVTYTDIDKDKLIMLWNSRPQDVALQNKTTILRDELQITKTHLTDVTNKYNSLEIEFNKLKKDMQTAISINADLQNKQVILKKSLDDTIKLETEKNMSLQIALDDEKIAHKHYKETTQKQLDTTKEALKTEKQKNNILQKEINDKQREQQRIIETQLNTTRKALDKILHLSTKIHLAELEIERISVETLDKAGDEQGEKIR